MQASCELLVGFTLIVARIEAREAVEIGTTTFAEGIG